MIRVFRKISRHHLPLLGIGLVVLVWSIGSGALEFALPIFANSIIDDVAQVGFLLALPAIVALFIDIPIGALADKLGKKKLVISALVLLCILGLSLRSITLSRTLTMFLIAWAIGYQLLIIPAASYVMQISPRREEAEYFGFYDALTSIGFAIGPLIGGLLLADSLDPIFIFYALMCGLAALIGFTIVKRLPLKPEPFVYAMKELFWKDKLFLKEIKEFKRLRGTGVMVLFVSFVFTFWVGLVWVFEPLYFISLGIAPLTGGLILAAFSIPFILFEFIAGYIADNFGKKKVLMIGLLVAGIFTMFFGNNTDPQVLVVLAFLSGTGFAFAKPAMAGVLTSITYEYRRGEICGVWNTAEDLGFIAGPLLGGLLAASVGIGGAFIVVGLLVTLSVILVYLAGKHIH